MKNILAALMLISLGAILVYAFIFASGGLLLTAQPSLSQPKAISSCNAGQTQTCSVNGCSGNSICIDGTWSGCKWQTICTTGTRQACLNNSCTYAVKECNSCGTGYGSCFVP